MPRMFWLALEWAEERRTAKRQENAKNGEHFGGGEAQAGARPQPDSVNPHTATSVCEKGGFRCAVCSGVDDFKLWA